MNSSRIGLHFINQFENLFSLNKKLKPDCIYYYDWYVCSQLGHNIFVNSIQFNCFYFTSLCSIFAFVCVKSGMAGPIRIYSYKDLKTQSEATNKKMNELTKVKSEGYAVTEANI